jgi:hypothetical protein
VSIRGIQSLLLLDGCHVQVLRDVGSGTIPGRIHTNRPGHQRVIIVGIIQRYPGKRGNLGRHVARGRRGGSEQGAASTVLSRDSPATNNGDLGLDIAALLLQGLGFIATNFNGYLRSVTIFEGVIEIQQGNPPTIHKVDILLFCH